MSIEYAQGWDDAKAQVTTDNSATLVNALAEIERLKEELGTNQKYTLELETHIGLQKEIIERKSAALLVALDALEYHTIQTRPIHSTDVAIATLREAL